MSTIEGNKGEKQHIHILFIFYTISNGQSSLNNFGNILTQTYLMNSTRKMISAYPYRTPRRFPSRLRGQAENKITKLKKKKKQLTVQNENFSPQYLTVGPNKRQKI